MSVLQEGYSKQKIEEAIRIYDKLYPTGPDSIAASIVSYRNELREAELNHTIGKHGIVNNSESDRRIKMVMPSNLYVIIKKKFPTAFKADFKKFERDFPVFFKGWRT